jgi:translation initiation factor IF-2
MNISTLARLLGKSIPQLRDIAQGEGIPGFQGRNTRIPYNSAVQITKVIAPERLEKLKNDDKIYLPASLTVAELSEAIGKPPGIVVKTLILNGVMATLNEKIDYDTASLISQELGVEVYPESPEAAFGVKEESLEKTFGKDLQGNLIDRPPVVTVMGHVDHGKTTLLDTIRKSNVVAGEAGAITQHISSYQIEYQGKKVTFIDTPGHEAFTAMRARGTQLADFIILMVSAVEGPKPQTVEVIERAKMSKTPVVVALNKIDLPNADQEKAKAEVAKFGLVPEEWGGDVQFIPVSAKNNVNLDKLLEAVLLMAEVAELKGQVDEPGQAVVVESHVDQHLGIVATILVTRHHLKVGDSVACGEVTGKIRAIRNSEGKVVQEAKICDPVQITGLSGIVSTGDQLTVYATQKEAQNAADMEKVKKAHKRTYIYQQETSSGDLNVILKADVAGSLEALKESILKIPQENTKIRLVGESVGKVTEGDVEFAQTTGSTILAFHTDILPKAADALDKQKVNLIQSAIIYEILEWVEEQLLKSIKHETRIEVIGKAEVLASFKSDKPRLQVFGGEVKWGKLLDNKEFRLLKDGEEAGRLEIVELQKNKVKVKEVNIAQQFGASVKGKAKVEVGSFIECIDEIVI